MKVLIVCSGNNNQIAPFISDQVLSLNKTGVETSYYLIKGKGIIGYLKNLNSLKRALKQEKPDLIHAHYGFAGLLTNLQRRIPVVTSYHGSDINNRKNLLLSKLSIFLSRQNIFVSTKLAKRAKRENAPMIPCGVDLKLFYPMNNDEARQQLGLEKERKYVLFSSYFENSVKNYPLAKAAIEEVNKTGINVELLEFKGYTRDQAAILFNAVDCVLVTSHKESGPLIIKEAMAVNTPAVSVDVGDVKWVTKDTEGYIITTNKVIDIANAIRTVLLENNFTSGRIKIKTLQLDSLSIARSIKEIYTKVAKPATKKGN